MGPYVWAHCSSIFSKSVFRQIPHADLRQRFHLQNAPYNIIIAIITGLIRELPARNEDWKASRSSSTPDEHLQHPHEGKEKEHKQDKHRENPQK